ncbi:hypothetical protein Micbo1qcDRAFT_214911 [Microdochium bolleyi]|uniref:Uncharacterized protein n=1 Tax=Microdochium bolleyi TaxID=196109 RepID=A0A136IT92_9PEZI|nr:hypothetical protein Micbo1qcDRAFT_214911 [Microdochium bolleyi]
MDDWCDYPSSAQPIPLNPSGKLAPSRGPQPTADERTQDYARSHASVTSAHKAQGLKDSVNIPSYENKAKHPLRCPPSWENILRSVAGYPEQAQPSRNVGYFHGTEVQGNHSHGYLTRNSTTANNFRRSERDADLRTRTNTLLGHGCCRSRPATVLQRATGGPARASSIITSLRDNAPSAAFRSPIGSEKSKQGKSARVDQLDKLKPWHQLEPTTQQELVQDRFELGGG